MKKKILIISYALPPYGGIGGRRWAKFGRLMLEAGHDVKFLSASSAESGHLRWEHDHKAIGQHITYFDSQFPKVLEKGELSTMEKVSYRMAMLKVKSRNDGNFYDPSFSDGPILVKQIKEFMAKGYLTVICSGAPFNYLFHLAQFRAVTPDLKLVVDLRDPWTKQDWSYGFQTIDQRRKSVEEDREAYVMQLADRVFTVADRMTFDLEAYDMGKNKFHTIHNGFDPDEFKEETRKVSAHLTFCYVGNLYEGAMGQVSALLKGLDRLKEERPALLQSIKIDFYGGVPAGFAELTAKYDCMAHHGTVNLKQAHEAIHNADVALLFLIDALNYSFSTKFFEYLALDKKTLLFAKEGDTSIYITEQDIGWHFDENHFVSLIDQLITKKSHGQDMGLPESFDKNLFNINSQCDRLLRFI